MSTIVTNLLTGKRIVVSGGKAGPRTSAQVFPTRESSRVRVVDLMRAPVSAKA